MTADANETGPKPGHAHPVACTMCMDLHECPECDPDQPDEDCTMCFGRGDCPECGDGSDEAETPAPGRGPNPANGDVANVRSAGRRQ